MLCKCRHSIRNVLIARHPGGEACGWLRGARLTASRMRTLFTVCPKWRQPLSTWPAGGKAPCGWRYGARLTSAQHPRSGRSRSALPADPRSSPNDPTFNLIGHPRGRGCRTVGAVAPILPGADARALVYSPHAAGGSEHRDRGGRNSKAKRGRGAETTARIESPAPITWEAFGD
jgi:hypothetical protein